MRITQHFPSKPNLYKALQFREKTTMEQNLDLAMAFLQVLFDSQAFSGCLHGSSI